MRGKVIDKSFRKRLTGITPAYAGKRNHRFCRYGLSEGSPPPMRGKVWFCQKGFVFDGITPAYAGKSFCGQSACISQQDHPRLCGEKEKKAKRNATIEGSPPPMRGKGHSRILMVPAGGITPAYAGKRGRKAVCYNHAEDHPRLCGEKAYFSRILAILRGSPPPMRGKGSGCLTRFFYSRITPAYAGKRKANHFFHF